MDTTFRLLPRVGNADLLKAIVDTVTTAIGSRSTSPLFSVEEAFTGLIEKGRTQSCFEKSFPPSSCWCCVRDVHHCAQILEGKTDASNCGPSLFAVMNVCAPQTAQFVIHHPFCPYRIHAF